MFDYFNAVAFECLPQFSAHAQAVALDGNGFEGDLAHAAWVKATASH
jgi:hypothetical protein